MTLRIALVIIPEHYFASMKIIATGDWHLGNVFHGVERLEEQKLFLARLLERLVEEQPEVLLIAGDVFDNGNPSGEAQELYFRFLKGLSTRMPGLTTVIIAGNHDSVRLEAPRELTAILNVHIRGKVRRQWVASSENNSEEGNKSGYWQHDFDDLIIPVGGTPERPEIVILAVPFLRSDVLNGSSYSSGVRELLTGLTRRSRELYPDSPTMLLAHFYASGSEIARRSSEKIIVGGLEQIDLSKWEERPDFIISGHIHKRQPMTNTYNAWYTGSVLPMSFAEKDYTHGVERIIIDEDGNFTNDQIVFEPRHKLVDIPASGDSFGMSFSTLKRVIEEELPEREGKGLSGNHSYVRLFIDREKINSDHRRELEALVAERDAVLCTVEETQENAALTVTGNTKLRKVEDILERSVAECLEEAFTLIHNKELNERQKEIISQLTNLK